MSEENVMSAPAPLRDRQGNRIPDKIELAAMAIAAERDARISRHMETPRDVLFRAAELDAEAAVDEAAVAAALAERERLGQPAGGDVRDQLRALHSHTPG